MLSAANTHDSKLFEPLPPIPAPRGIKVRIARRGTENKQRLGRHRWVVERTISWLLRFKRLGLR